MKLAWLPEARDDIRRLFDFLVDKDPDAALRYRLGEETIVVIRVWHSRELRDSSWPNHIDARPYPLVSGLTTASSGKREKSRSADHRTRTP